MEGYEPISQMNWSQAFYIGDGVYVLDDPGRRMFWIRTDREWQPHVIAFEDNTWESLQAWMERRNNPQERTL